MLHPFAPTTLSRLLVGGLLLTTALPVLAAPPPPPEPSNRCLPAPDKPLHSNFVEACNCAKAEELPESGGVIYNCQCGALQCVVTGSRGGDHSLVCR